MLHPDLTVADVLKLCPPAMHTFIALHTDCVGCYLMSFCTLHDVADQYDLRLEALLEGLTKSIDKNATLTQPQQ
jgi:hypothetical protein